MTLPPADGHRWVSLTDENGHVWLFDTTFLRSGYRCIYGAGCPSIDTEPDHTGALGCCLHGAHLVDDDDRTEVAAATALLDDTNWQYRRQAQRKGGPFKQSRAGEWMTRRIDGACIFLNRAGFPGGGGCALHRGALEAGRRPLDWKPDVCWQVPIRLEVHTNAHGHDTVFIRAWERRDWGEGGDDFHWWCIEQEEAYGASDPVYLTCRDELTELIGATLYERLVSALADIAAETTVSLRPADRPPGGSAGAPVRRCIDDGRADGSVGRDDLGIRAAQRPRVSSDGQNRIGVVFESEIVKLDEILEETSEAG